jgi:serine/threonine protein kinase
VLLEKLATGGMAEVFLARGTGAGGIGKFFAIKRILPQYADSPEFIEMFKDEAKIAINLNHSNIVSIHEFGVEKGQFFLVMDYVEGRNLRQILNKMKKSALQFSVDQIVYIVKEVAAGLDHAHRCIDGSTGKPLNITHRDMSPQNVMTSFEGEVKIVDFGIAKAESQIETTRAGTLKGKFGYMSPEQAEGQPVDLRTDIFSLGIVLWELLANDRLFVANNEINTLRKIRDCQIPSLRKINPNIHAELERIVQKALARDRNLRYQTGAALHRDLNRFLNRQYPDFSPQDFAVFIKSVFADEILSLRKRLVEYTKLNVTPGQSIEGRPRDGEFDDRTSLLDTNTNSLVISDSQVGQGPVSSVMNNIPSISQITEPSASIEKIPRQDISEMTHTDAASKPKGTNPAGVLNEAALLAEANVVRDVKPKIVPLNNGPSAGAPPPPSPDKQQPSPILNTQALETEDIGEPSIRRRQRPQARIEYASSTQSQNPARFATMMVFALFCVSFYTYLCKFFPDVMAPYIEKTEPYLGAYYDYVLPNRGAKPGTTVATGGGFEQQPDRKPGSELNPMNATNPNALMVTSNPSGAEIWLNQVNTGKTTPQMIEVPAKDIFTVTIRKRGYDDYRRENVTRESVGRKLEAILEKLSVGYLDVEIFPPQQAILYINGKQVAMQKAYARDVLVPANRVIKVRAESPNGDSSEEVQIQVPVDQKRSLRLNPRKNARVPSGSPNQ